MEILSAKQSCEGCMRHFIVTLVVLSSLVNGWGTGGLEEEDDDIIKGMDVVFWDHRFYAGMQHELRKGSPCVEEVGGIQENELSGSYANTQDPELGHGQASGNDEDTIRRRDEGFGEDRAKCKK